MSEDLFASLGTSSRVLKLLGSSEAYGGPQSINDVCESLNMTNRNARSILSRMFKSGKVERVEKGVYRVNGDDRDYNPDMPHYSE